MLWQPETGLPIPQSEAEWLGLSAGVGFAMTNVLTRPAKALSLQAKSLGVWAGVTLVGLRFMPFADMPFVVRSAERLVGKAGGGRGRYRWSPYIHTTNDSAFVSQH